ncbi:MAG TPA: NPCBM/NEW2 domain-containing protein [Pirellulales bacterium]|nr:NPCBM/NEW2 domain-containing protein [Pirellulales bacterium]
MTRRAGERPVLGRGLRKYSLSLWERLGEGDPNHGRHPSLGPKVTWFLVLFAVVALVPEIALGDEPATPTEAAVEVPATPAAAVPGAPPAAPPTATPTANPPAAPDKPATPPAPPVGPAVTTIYDERLPAKVTGIEDGKLIVATDPVRQIPLDEISLVDLGNTPELAAEWVGQVNHDVVQVGGAAGGNGIQDVLIRLRGLADGKNIKQIVALTRGGKGRGIWRLDTARTPNWKLALERAGTAATADVYVEPINQDCFDREIELTVTYEDGMSGKISFKATTHTDHQLKVGATAAATPAANAEGPGAAQVVVYGRDKSVIRGELVSLDDETVTVKTGWAAEVKLPLTSARGIGFPSTGTAADRQMFESRLADPAAEDTAVVLGREKDVSQITGVAHGVKDGKLGFTFEGEDRSLNVARLVGLVYAKGRPKAGDAKPYQVAHFVSGDMLAGVWRALDDKQLEFETPSGKIVLPRTAVARVVFRNGKVTFVSDLEPTDVEETPYFGRLLSYRRDQSLDDGPLTLKGKPYAKGLAVHSRSVLSYAIDGEYETFKATVGFDASSQGRGRVSCRVLGDGRELFGEPDLAATAEPVTIDVPLAGVKQLSLEVDYGEGEDTGDRVIWADARLFRGEKK